METKTMRKINQELSYQFQKDPNVLSRREKEQKKLAKREQQKRWTQNRKK